MPTHVQSHLRFEPARLLQAHDAGIHIPIALICATPSTVLVLLRCFAHNEGRQMALGRARRSPSDATT